MSCALGRRSWGQHVLYESLRRIAIPSRIGVTSNLYPNRCRIGSQSSWLRVGYALALYILSAICWLPTPNQSFLVQINVGVVSFPSRFLVGGSST